MQASETPNPDCDGYMAAGEAVVAPTTPDREKRVAQWLAFQQNIWEEDLEEKKQQQHACGSQLVEELRKIQVPPPTSRTALEQLLQPKASTPGTNSAMPCTNKLAAHWRQQRHQPEVSKQDLESLLSSVWAGSSSNIVGSHCGSDGASPLAVQVHSRSSTSKPPLCPKRTPLSRAGKASEHLPACFPAAGRSSRPPLSPQRPSASSASSYSLHDNAPRPPLSPRASCIAKSISSNVPSRFACEAMRTQMLSSTNAARDAITAPRTPAPAATTAPLPHPSSYPAKPAALPPLHIGPALPPVRTTLLPLSSSSPCSPKAATAPWARPAAPASSPSAKAPAASPPASPPSNARASIAPWAHAPGPPSPPSSRASKAPWARSAAPSSLPMIRTPSDPCPPPTPERCQGLPPRHPRAAAFHCVSPFRAGPWTTATTSQGSLSPMMPARRS